MEAARPWLRAQLRYPLTSRDSDARMASPPHVSATARHPVTVPQLSQLAASINCSAARSQHQLQWTRNVLSRVYQAGPVLSP